MLPLIVQVFFMDILIVTAAEIEEKAVKEKVPPEYKDNFRLNYLCTRPSVPFTVFWLTRRLLQNPLPDLCINVGICGSFNSEYPPGTVLNITRDAFADIALEKGSEMQDLFNAGFWHPNSDGFRKGILENKQIIPGGIEQATGITVNTTSGNRAQIEQRQRKFQADTESMEGAAAAFVCENTGVPWLQIRAVSNTIEERHKQLWDIPAALENLGNTMTEFLASFDFNKFA